MAYKVFTNGSVLNASEVNDNLMNQAVITFTNSTARGSALTSPVQGMLTYLEDTDTYEYWDGAAWSPLVSAPAASGASSNAIINGAFEINQRNFSSTTTAGTFLFDRWKAVYAGGTSTYTAQTFTPGAAPVAGYEATNFQRVAVTGQSAGSDVARLDQTVEDVRSFAGQTVTMSFWAKANSGTPFIGVSFEQAFGSGGSSTTQTVATRQAITTSWARYSFTTTIPSISGKTIGTNSSLVAEIYFSAGASVTAFSDVGIQNNTFDIWGVQLEAGSTATPFRRNANSIQGELAACQRYYYRSTQSSYGFLTQVGSNQSTTQSNAFVRLPVTMRIPPNSVEFSTLQILNMQNFGQTAVTNVVLNQITNDIAELIFITAGGMVSGNISIARVNGATGFIGLSAEL